MSALDALHLLLFGLLALALLALAAAAAALWQVLNAQAATRPSPSRTRPGPVQPASEPTTVPQPAQPSAPEPSEPSEPPVPQALGRELRTGLNAVLGFASLGREASEPAALREALERIELAGQQMLRSIRAHLPGEESVSPTAATASARIAGLRVLLVEDQAINREVATRMLARAGVHCASAPSGAHALGLACGQRFDAVLMDLNMHGVDGLETSRRLQALPGFAPTPIIALSAEVAPGTRARCAAAGIVDFLSKPIDRDALYACLARWCRPLPAGVAANAEPGGEDTADGLKPRPARPAADAQSLAPPPGFDFAAALRRADGDEAFLRRLLRAFIEDFATLGQDLERLREAGRRDQAARLVHAFKGVASTVGGHELAAQAAAFEAELGDPETGWPWARLPSFLDDWCAARERLAALLQQGASSQPAALDAETIAAKLDELEAGLQRADPTSEDLWEDLRPALAARHAAETAAVDQALRQFAFEAALAALQQLRTRLGSAGS